MSRETVRILVVDDERSMREFLEIFFVSEGYQAVTACDVDTAPFRILTSVSLLVNSSLVVPNLNDRLSVFSVLILKNKYPPGPPQANKLVSSKLKVVTIISPSLQDRKEVKISSKNNFFISSIDLLKSKVTQFF